jgi:hypothetical protein
LHVVTDACLTDRDYGPWTGVSRKAGIARWGAVDRAPGVEPRPTVVGRAVEGLTGIARRSLGGAVALVSHDAVNRQVLVALDAGLGDPDALPQDNGWFNTLEWRDGSWTVLSVNELPPTRNRPRHSCPKSLIRRLQAARASQLPTVATMIQKNGHGPVSRAGLPGPPARNGRTPGEEFTHGVHRKRWQVSRWQRGQGPLPGTGLR